MDNVTTMGNCFVNSKRRPNHAIQGGVWANRWRLQTFLRECRIYSLTNSTNSSMIKKMLVCCLAVGSLVGCSANSRWLHGGMMSFDVEQAGPNAYRLTATGAGSQSKSQVEQGFLVRAGELCNGSPFDHTVEISPYSYNDWNGTFIATHHAFRAVGTVSCK